jgi:hypothetical protein
MEIRDKCIDNITYQTNTLIIRLDKLINERPEDINRVKGTVAKNKIDQTLKCHVSPSFEIHLG